MNRTRSATTLSRRALLGASATAGVAATVGCSDSPATEGDTSTLRIAIPTDVDFTGIQRFQAVNQPVRRLIFDNLIDKDASGEYRPGLAESFEWSGDGTRLRLVLRGGVTFHTGRALGPQDVVANVERATAEGSGVQVAKLLNRASGVRVDGDTGVIIELEQPFAAVLDALAVLPIVDPETADGLTGGREVIGTGPFRLTGYRPGSGVTLAAYPEWWSDEKPALSQVELTVVDNVQASLAALRSGSTDLVQRMLPRDAAGLASDPEFRVGATEGFDVYVGMNTAVESLSDRRVRQAIAWALDRDRIAEQVYQGYATPSCVPWPDTTPGVTPERVGHYGYDIDRAKALLADSGQSGLTVKMISYAADPAYQAIQDIVQFGLTEAGLTVETVGADAATFTKHLQSGTMPGLWVTAVALTTLGPTTALMTANPMTPGKNSANWTDETYAALVQDLVDADGDDQRAAATAAVTDHLLDEAFHATVVQARTPWASTAAVEGVSTDLTLSIDLDAARVGGTR